MKRLIPFISLVLFTFHLFGQLTGPKAIPGDFETIEAAVAALNSQGAGFGGVTLIDRAMRLTSNRPFGKPFRRFSLDWGCVLCGPHNTQTPTRSG